MLENEKIMLKKILIISGVLILSLIIIVGFTRLLSGEDDWICVHGQWVKHGNPSASKPTGGCGAASGTPSVAPSAAELPEANIYVSSPRADEEVNLPIRVSGQARTFENTLSVRLKEPGGRLLFGDSFIYNSGEMGQFGNFEKEISYLTKKPRIQDITLDVFWTSPKDGSELDTVSIPLKLNLADAATVKVFFNNEKLESADMGCNEVFPVERTLAKTQTPVRRTLEILLEGVSADEKLAKYYSSINPDVKINSLVVSEGVARADFDETLETEVGGSCRVAAIRAQLTQTLKQFSAIKSVIISINGRTEDILQL